MVTLIEVLRLLDPEDDSHWTSDDSPRMSKIHELMGSDEATRQDVVEIAPDFTRETAREPEKLLMNREEELTDQLKEAEAELKATEERTAELRRQIQKKQIELNESRPQLSDAETIQGYLASENRQRAARHAQRREILKSIPPEELDPRSPLDAAMARKRRRGAQRPQRSPMT